MTDYEIWLLFNNEAEGFQLPENPSSIQIKDANSNKTYHISGIGEINVLKDPSLTEYTFEGVFPSQKSPLVIAKRALEPKIYVDYIRKWMVSKQPIRFKFTGSTFSINTLASIEAFEWKEAGGAVGDIEYKLSLKKYVHYAAQKVKVVNQAAANKQASPRPDNRAPAKTYKLVKGDSLWKIAQKFLGSGSRYKEIQKLNNIKESELRKLPIGLEVKLPPK
ncbi:LysM peptidoglycan-binding domain-containing protein [Cytobacillus praedii]|uniref:LysM peptidoglycan-binding domain-containing protein n=1 Tax=Cytobacillus praedii TaxID=1742358 RepID=A0A4R1AV82_9BACI|nr:LysM peptidoglycan-binding domain-containing protein [Cytobacillus praedii]TCJ04092.1 LysM peptidoglycan-binding domain-containing protein [Cytobacillus praedii]